MAEDVTKSKLLEWGRKENSCQGKLEMWFGANEDKAIAKWRFLYHV